MKVIFTARARADLRSIGHWIARDNPARAISFVTELRHKALALDEASAHYPIIANAGTPRPIRRLSYRDYRIVYQVDAARHTATILFVHHGARNLPETF